MALCASGDLDHFRFGEGRDLNRRSQKSVGESQFLIGYNVVALPIKVGVSLNSNFEIHISRRSALKAGLSLSN